ncbi:MAG TPA: IS256 family transposase [Spirochaetota bacterium]|nr:IS256 family transposase [Spirochaetota bacterium]
MNNNKQKLFEDLLKDYLNEINSKGGIQELLSYLLNIIMNKERELHLSQFDNDKANGYYSRDLITSSGNLNINVPRVRKGNFRPCILPPHYKKCDASFDEFILKLVLNNYSPNKIKMLLNSMNLPYSSEQIEELKDELYQKSQELINKQLPDNFFVIFIDAYHVQIKDDDIKQIKNSVIYNIIGIDMSGKKDLIGFYVYEGNETREDYLVILNNLIQRGVKRVLLFVTDDFSGLDDAINTLFPNSEHQLCFIHMQRNTKRNMSKVDSKEFNKKLTTIRFLNDYNKAIVQFETLCNEYKDKYPTFINYLLKKKEKYFTFIKYPEEIRKHIYTTNIIENLHSRLEVMRVNSGGYFQSTKTAQVSIYVLLTRLKDGKWRSPLNSFKSCEYEINQMFNVRFYKQTQNL